MPVKVSGDKKEAWSAGTYNGVECSFSFKDHTLSVIESTHFTTLAAWNLFVHISNEDEPINCYKLTTIEDDLWFYADIEKLSVFRTSAGYTNNLLACHVQHEFFQVRFLPMAPDLQLVPQMDISTYGMPIRAKLNSVSKAIKAIHHLFVGGRKNSCSCLIFLTGFPAYQNTKWMAI